VVPEVMMAPWYALTDNERQLLEKLAEAGKPTELRHEDLMLAKILERRGLIFFVRDTALAVILPKGRHALAGEEPPPPGTTRLGFLK
jgi:hypothetical protein